MRRLSRAERPRLRKAEPRAGRTGPWLFSSVGETSLQGVRSLPLRPIVDLGGQRSALRTTPDVVDGQERLHGKSTQ